MTEIRRIKRALHDFPRKFAIFIFCLYKAQKLGLVDAPIAPLTDKEWQDVKTKSNQRNDSDQPCVICKEEFGTQRQVRLLGCFVCRISLVQWRTLGRGGGGGSDTPQLL